MGNATSLFNLMRNIGGSIGIALTGTMLARMQQANTTLLGAHVTAYDAGSRAMIAQAAGGMIASGTDPMTAANRVYGSLFGTVWRQASMVSFVTVFQLLGLLFLSLVPLVLIMRRPSHQGGPPGAH